MKLKKLIINNFRGYQGRIEVEFDEITALIGKNDIGKTTILDALGVFFDHKLCKYDFSDKCVYAGEDEDVSITCEFVGLPSNLIIDAASNTSLESEFLLTESRTLSLSKVFSKGKGTGVMFINCMHPSAADIKGILQYKNSELKAYVDKNNVPVDDRRSNVSMRQAIYQSHQGLELKAQSISLAKIKEDGKVLWEKIREYLPHFALFRADRPSTDEEAEVQDPMKIAISQAIEDMSEELESVKDMVKSRVLEVAENTLVHLKNLDAELASTCRVSPD